MLEKKPDPKVLFEDNHLLALCKPPGLLVQADATRDATLIDWGKFYLKQKYEKPGAVFLHPAHRLDRPVSGLVLMARTSKSLERLNEMFRSKKMDKTYLAVTLKKPQNLSGRLVHFLEKDEKLNVVRAWENARKAPASAKESTLDYEWIGEFEGRNLLKINPLTGRSHQIRVQLRELGCPILGDVKYSAPFKLADNSIGLHSFGLSFIHPVRLEKAAIWAPVFFDNSPFLSFQKAGFVEQILASI